MKKTKEPTTAQLATKLRKKCVELAKHKARELVGDKCEHCGRSKAEGWQMHGSHIYSEGAYVSMSADVDNILCLCAMCHTGGMFRGGRTKMLCWHSDPVYFGNWFDNKYPKRAKILKERARKSQQADLWFWEQKWKSLNGKEL